MVPERMDFGIFMAPFHRTGENPTLALQRDLELVRGSTARLRRGLDRRASLRRLGNDRLARSVHRRRRRAHEEHPPRHGRRHPCPTITPSTSPTASSCSTTLRAAARCSASARARCPSDAYMLGIEPTRQREMMDEGLGVIIRLMTEDEPITYETDWFKLRDAQLQLKPYQRPTMPMAVASTLSPAGMTTAGKHGVGVLSVASYSEQGLRPWRRSGSSAKRPRTRRAARRPTARNWRVVMPFHLADTREEAISDIAEGLLSLEQRLLRRHHRLACQLAGHLRPRNGGAPARFRRRSSAHRKTLSPESAVCRKCRAGSAACWASRRSGQIARRRCAATN